jgi:hypothetical protein
LPGTNRTGTETGAEDPSHPSQKSDELNSNQDGDSTISTKTSQQSYDDKDGCISSTNTTSVHHSDSNHSMQEDSPDSSTPTPKSLAPSSTIQDWKKYINFKQLKNNTPTQNVADQGATTLTVCGCLGQFSVVPNCHQIQFMKPPLEHTTINDLKMKEFLEILEHFTDVIQEKLPLTKLHKIFDKHCNQIKDENQRTLVIIDGGRYEFYIPSSDHEIRTSIFFKEIITPYITKWTKSTQYQSIKTGIEFIEMLYQYISSCFPKEYKIYSVSFLLDYPKSSIVRQWSHIDGDESHFQGSVLCGNGISITMEFPVLSPKVQTVNDLQQVWTFFPKNSPIFVELEKNQTCITLLKKYGTLLNHLPDSPLNPESQQKRMAKHLSLDNTAGNSMYKAGTVLRMPGNTIHAGPRSHPTKCRGIFLCC